MQTYLAIGEAPHLALGLWVLLAICFLGAFCVGLYGVKDVLKDEWDAYRAEHPAAPRTAPAAAGQPIRPEAGRAV